MKIYIVIGAFFLGACLPPLILKSDIAVGIGLGAALIAAGVIYG